MAGGIMRSFLKKINLKENHTFVVFFFVVLFLLVIAFGTLSFIDGGTSGEYQYNKEYVADQCDGDKFQYVFKLNTDGNSTITITGITTSGDVDNLSIPKTLNIGEEQFTVTQIGSNAFNWMVKRYSIKGNLEIPDTVHVIGPSAFKRQVYLENISFIGESQLKEIGSEAFAEITQFNNDRELIVNIPKTVENIGSYSFSKFGADADNITSAMKRGSIKINLSKDVALKTIGNFAFSGQSGSIYIPSTVESIGYAAFSSGIDIEISPQNNFYDIKDGGLYTKDGLSIIAGIYCGSETLTIKAGTQNIGAYCFFEINYNSGNRSEFVTTKKIIVPDSVASIETYAFTYTNNGVRDELRVELNIDSISDYSFAQSDISSVSIPSSVTYIGAYSFCDSLIEQVIIQNDSLLEVISDYAFKGCKNLTFFQINGLSEKNEGLSIGTHAFTRSDGSVELDPLKFEFKENTRIIKIGNYAMCTSEIKQFGDTDGRITIPSSVRTLGEGAFIGKLGNRETSANVLEGKNYVNGIGRNKHIAEILFEANNNINEIPLACFAGYGDVMGPFESTGENKYSYRAGTVTKIDISGLTSLSKISDYAFQYVYMELGAELKLPDSLSFIGASCFYECYFPNDYVLPQSIKEIGDYAFYLIFSGQQDKQFSVADKSSLISVGDSAFNTWFDVNLSNATKLESMGELCKNDTTYTLPHGVIDIDLRKYLEYAGEEKGKKRINGGAFLNKYSSNLTVNEHIDFITRDVLNGAIDSIEIQSTWLNVDSTGKILYTEHDGQKSIQKVLSDADQLSLNEYSVLMPYAIVGCNKLTELNIPQSLAIRNDSLFGASTLTSIYVKEPTEAEIQYLKQSGLITCIEGDLFGLEGNNLYKQHDVSENNIYLPTLISGLRPTYQLGYSDGTFTIQFVIDGGYSYLDVIVSDVDGSEIPYDDGYHVAPSKLVKITTKDRINVETYNVTFDSGGGYFSPGLFEYKVNVPKGMSIIDKEKPNSIPKKDRCTFLGWSLDGTPYSFSTKVTNDITLKALWSEQSSKVRIEYSTLDGEISCNIPSGSEVEIGTELSFSVKLSYGHEVPVWVCEKNGFVSKTVGSTFNVTMDCDVYLSVVSRNVAQSGAGASIPYIVSSGLPSADDIQRLVKVVSIGGGVSDATSMVWKGQSSVPLVVGDYLYVRIGTQLMKIEVDTGLVIKSVSSVEVSAFYYYITYGNGVIIDNNAFVAYDLDLNQIYCIPEIIKNTSYQNQISYYGGYFYFPYGSGLYRFSAIDENEDIKDEMKNLELCCSLNINGGSWSLYGSPVMAGNHLYYAITAGYDRGLLAFDTITKETNTVILNGINKQLLDDAWLTYSDGKLYLTAYSSGLFGAKASSNANQIVCVEVNGCIFSSPTYTSVTNGGTAAMTNLAIYRGRGYLVNGSELLVYNMSDMSLIYKERSAFNHGGIVLDTSRATEGNGWEVSIYVIPYDLRGGVMVHTDNQAKNLSGMAVWNKSIPSDKQYCSQAIRTGSEGQMIWTNDTGLVFIYTLPEKNNYYFFLENGDRAGWYRSTGSSAFDALSKLDPSIVSLNDDVKVPVSLFGEGGSYNIFMFNGTLKDGMWKNIDNFIDTSNDTYHYYVITKSNGVSASHWTYDSGESIGYYTFQPNVGDRTVIGKALVRIDPIVITNFEESVTIAIGGTHKLEPNYSRQPIVIQWHSSNEQVATVESGVIRGLTEGTATITLYADSSEKTCLVKVVKEIVEVSYVYDDLNNDVDTLTVPVGDYTVAEPREAMVASKLAEGYAFMGWYTSKDLTGDVIK
ncbi:MAG: leucine-rich repeat protein, partial [Candidatus Methanarcanum hacksteinii]|nr:leucine-rich repeat protein [Candidatus Methanarcanum hacksteinii]